MSLKCVMKWYYISIVFPLRSVKVQLLSIKQHSQPLTHPSWNSRHHQSFPLQEKFRSVYMSSIQANITVMYECLIKKNFNLRYGWATEVYLSFLSKMFLRCIFFFCFVFFPFSFPPFSFSMYFCFELLFLLLLLWKELWSI